MNGSDWLLFVWPLAVWLHVVWLALLFVGSNDIVARGVAIRPLLFGEHRMGSDLLVHIRIHSLDDIVLCVLGLGAHPTGSSHNWLAAGI